ncbi:MAG: hypothetical protein J0H55_10475 [Chitinophagaceae bacterium]|nr:hypothetical protein [Chitinophagaceae bacterium]
MKQLTKEEMKRIVGGMMAPPPDDGNGCEVTCNPGFYACCNRNILDSYCHCYANGSNNSCDSGGPGSSECKVDQEL